MLFKAYERTKIENEVEDKLTTITSIQKVLQTMKHILRVLALTATAALVLMNGCSPTKPEIGKEQAISLAKEEAVRLGWKAMEVDGTILDEGVWKVYLWRLPKMPGGHATFHVSGDGKVIRVIRGL